MNLFGIDEIVQLRVFLLLYATERVHCVRLEFDLEVKASRRSAAASEIHRSDLLEANVNRWLVDVDEAALKRIQIAGGSFERAANGWGARVTKMNEIGLGSVVMIMAPTKKIQIA